MMEPIFQSIVYDNANCPVCLEEYEDPKLFFCCGYSLCRKCAKKLPVRKIVCVECADKMPRRNLYEHDQEVSVISCPLCRQDFPLPKGGVEELPSNPVLKQLLEYTPGNAARKELKKKVNESETRLENTTKKLLNAMDRERTAIGEYSEGQKNAIKQKAAHLKSLINQQARQFCLQIDENMKKETEMLSQRSEQVLKTQRHISREEIKKESEKIKTSSSEDILEEKDSILERLLAATSRYENYTQNALKDTKREISTNCLTFFPRENAEADNNIGYLMHGNSFQNSSQHSIPSTLATNSEVLNGENNNLPTQSRLFNPSNNAVDRRDSFCFAYDQTTGEQLYNPNSSDNLTFDQFWNCNVPSPQENLYPFSFLPYQSAPYNGL